MREHQIVINLKREQFEEVQRLARLSGSKSVAAYLRDRVLEHLDSLNNDDSVKQTTAPATEELLEINQELTRMHRELQVFIAESLSSTHSYDSEEDDLDDEIYYAYRDFQQETELEDAHAQESDTIFSAPGDPYAIFEEPVVKPLIKQPPPFNLHRTSSAHAMNYSGSDQQAQAPSPFSAGSDQTPHLEQDQDQQGILSPGRYQKHLPPAFSPTTSSTDTNPEPSMTAQTTGLDGTPTGSPPAAAGHNPTTQFQNHSPVNLPDAITPGAWSGISTTEAGIYSSSTGESIWLTPPNKVLTPGYQNDGNEQNPEKSKNAYSSNPPAGTGLQPAGGLNANIPAPGQAPKSGISGSGKSEQIVAHDELEDLAERAFAISPRLGAIDKLSNAPVGFRKRQIDDPLDDLIDDKIMEEAEKLRQASIEDAAPYESGVVYAFDTAENEQAPQIPPAQNISDLPVSFPQSGETQALTNNLALQLEQESRSDDPALQDPATDPDPSYAISSNPPTSETVDITDIASEQESNDDLPASGDPDSSPPPPAPSLEDSPPPPAPRPDYGTMTGPPPKRRRLPDDQSGDDDERISGGPPPKRRKR